MASTASGRIFIGCEDNDIYEFDYAYNSVRFLSSSHSRASFCSSWATAAAAR